VTDEPDIENLIEQSSFGTSGARALRRQTSDHVAETIVGQAELLYAAGSQGARTVDNAPPRKAVLADAHLIESVRAGQLDAYGQLYERHVSAAYNLARQLARSSAEADDLVSEAFARVLDTLRAGRGPDDAFRAYLLTSLRHVAYDKTRRDRKAELTDDATTVSGVSMTAELQRLLAAKAFARLPERWQTVLWHTEVEGQSPAEVAPLLGLTANGVSALAYRAREGLRQAYLQVHLAESTADRCRATTDKLGAWTRGGLSKREITQVEAHLDKCERCRALAVELADVNSTLRGGGPAGHNAVAPPEARFRHYRLPDRDWCRTAIEALHQVGILP
jgi:RNA polymerase sigma factor (sigma-70 family)